MPRTTSLPPSVPTKALAKLGYPVITSDGGGDTASLTIAEGQGPLVTTVTATDANSPTLTYSIVPTVNGGGADANLFTINPSTGALSFKTLPDYEKPADAGGDNIFNVTVSVSDGSLHDTQAMTIALTDVDFVLPVQFEAIVLNSANTANVPLGIDAYGHLTNNPADIVQIAAMSSSAALSIVSTKFVVAGTLQSAGANDPVDYDFVYLTDAEVQTKINAIP